MKHPFRRWLNKHKDKTLSSLLPQEVIEQILRNHPKLKNFFKERNTLMIIRHAPTLRDPIYEIQLTRDFGDRLETYAWVWMDAIDGSIVKTLPEA